MRQNNKPLQPVRPTKKIGKKRRRKILLTKIPKFESHKSIENTYRKKKKEELQKFYDKRKEERKAKLLY